MRVICVSARLVVLLTPSLGGSQETLCGPCVDLPEYRSPVIEAQDYELRERLRAEFESRQEEIYGRLLQEHDSAENESEEESAELDVSEAGKEGRVEEIDAAANE